MAAAIGAILLLVSGLGAVWAETTDQAEITILVRPPGGPPVPAPRPTPGSGDITSPAAPADRPIYLFQPSSPVLGARSGPGTVAARISLVEPHAESGEQVVVDVMLKVRDDRGTAAGWSVSFMSQPPKGLTWVPILVENRTQMIRRLLPRNSNFSPHGDKVAAGGVAGAFEIPTPVLIAKRGSGAGVFQQRLQVLVPPIEDKLSKGIVFVQVVFGP